MQPLPFFVGTYTQMAAHVPDPRGQGIQTCYLDPLSGSITPGSVYVAIKNPTWLTWHTDHLFAAYESFAGPSMVYQFAVSADHTLNLHAQAKCSGTGVCHLAFHNDKLYTAAYVSGQMDSYSTSDQLEHLSVTRYQGSGPVASRQEASHAHQVVFSPDNCWCYVCDLGADTIWCHGMDLTQPRAIPVPAGSGPRHMVFHPELERVYLIAELTADLLVFAYERETGALSLLEQLPTLPSDYNGHPSGAGICVHPSGHALYVSNRHHNSVSCYELNADGQPTYAARLTSGGEEPRAITVDPSGAWLLVANQNSNSIASYGLDPASGRVADKPAHLAHIGTPVCMAFKT
jgi:6-phosphogluconolactonase